ncbi:MAG TPA: DUF1552 domain-containing protein [Polyangiaceae bacterium]|nr:DUF1552 domain-containing protein [Polyangiaceae bacterium]
MPKRFEIRRRDLLKTGMGALFLAPLLRQRELMAQYIAPKRLILYFTPDSVPPDFWPEETGNEQFTLKAPMQAFAGLEPHMLFIRELNHTYKYDNHHLSGIGQVFTGERLVDTSSGFAAGPSIDQVVAPVIRGGTPRRSIHLQVDDGRTDSRHCICYEGASQPIIGELDPQRAFDDIFEGATFGEGGPAPGTGGGSGATTAATAATSTSGQPTPTTTGGDATRVSGDVERQVLQISTDQLRDIQGFLGVEEREKLERHVESLAELERQITAGMPASTSSTTGGNTGTGATTNTSASATNGGSVGGPIPEYTPTDCRETERTGNFDLRSEANISSWIQVQTDLLVAALACDRTRVASLQLHFSGAHLPNFFKSDLGRVGDSWHDEVAHLSATNATSRELFNQFLTYHAEWVAYLARQLDSIPEGDGSMLDNTLIMWGFEVGTDHNHDVRDFPYLLIGGRGFGIDSGRFLRNTRSEDAQRMHTAVLHAFGVDAAGFGERPDAGALPGVLV